jgi:3-hydroxy-9,10-secoandrosta-1,3,5(10)-triene-9,17-dione monooxygenase reductase component
MRSARMFHVNPVEPGAQIHSSDPFATPEQDKSAVRRFRGRLAAAVTLWTTPGPSGLTVSSMMVADGDPGRLLGLIDEESDFWAAVSQTRRFAVTTLDAQDQQLADRFAGLMPSPGGLLATGEWTETEYGPVPRDTATWAGCRLDGDRPMGWSLLLEATIVAAHPGTDGRPLLHHRGRYHSLG